MGKLRDRMLVDLQLSGAKASTQRTYLREAENLAKYFHKSPEELGEDELKAYLLYLMKESICPREPSASMWQPLNSYTGRH